MNGLRCTESSRTNTTKQIRPKEQKEYHTGNPNISRQKYIKEEPVIKITNTGQHKTKSKGRHKDRNFVCRYCDAQSWNTNHKCPARDIISHMCERKAVSRKHADLNNTNDKNELTATAETEESDTDRSMKRVNGKKKLNPPEKSYYYENKK